uniref:Elongation initiation factor 6 n=1 Tax=Amorphochlora amoebiformis TaxID=1561963 RepID=A0A0H5BKL7_9EUKA|nr:elongation initiation factor 6 [Amorphochlora amoebiformis]
MVLSIRLSSCILVVQLLLLYTNKMKSVLVNKDLKNLGLNMILTDNLCLCFDKQLIYELKKYNSIIFTSKKIKLVRLKIPDLTNLSNLIIGNKRGVILSNDLTEAKTRYMRKVIPDKLSIFQLDEPYNNLYSIFNISNKYILSGVAIKKHNITFISNLLNVKFISPIGSKFITNKNFILFNNNVGLTIIKDKYFLKRICSLINIKLFLFSEQKETELLGTSSLINNSLFISSNKNLYALYSKLTALNL